MLDFNNPISHVFKEPQLPQKQGRIEKCSAWKEEQKGIPQIASMVAEKSETYVLSYLFYSDGC